DAFEDLLIPVIVKALLKARILADPHPGVDGMAFGHVADPGAGFGRQGHARVAKDRRRAPRRFEQAQDHANGRRLAGAIPADEGKHAPAWYAEGHGIDGAPAAEVPG